MTNGGRKLGKHDVEYRKVDTRFELFRIVAYGASVALIVYVATWPLHVVSDMVDSLAGKDTKVDASFGLTVSIALSMTVNGLQYLIGRSRRSEILRMRERIKELETKLGVPEVNEDDDDVG